MITTSLAIITRPPMVGITTTPKLPFLLIWLSYTKTSVRAFALLLSFRSLSCSPPLGTRPHTAPQSGRPRNVGILAETQTNLNGKLQLDKDEYLEMYDALVRVVEQRMVRCFERFLRRKGFAFLPTHLLTYVPGCACAGPSKVQ